MEERFKELEKKIIKKGIFIFMAVGIVFGSIAGVGAYQMSAKEINYTPSNNKWKVNNVSDAIDDLLFKKVSNNYSTEEQVVGTWIDGKPLYQKYVTAHLGNYSVNTWTTIYNSLDSTCRIKTIPIIKRLRSNNAFTFNGESSSYTLGVSENGYEISIYCKETGWNNSDFEFVIQYTKTTDEATN